MLLSYDISVTFVNFRWHLTHAIWKFRYVLGAIIEKKGNLHGGLQERKHNAMKRVPVYKMKPFNSTICISSFCVTVCRSYVLSLDLCENLFTRLINERNLLEEYCTPPIPPSPLHLPSWATTMLLAGASCTESGTCVVTWTHSTFGDRAFAAAGPGLWNSLPPHLRDADLPYSRFWRSLKTFLFGYWGHGAVWTILTSPSRNNLTYLLTPI